MVTILAFLFVFSLIVVIHELGHFWAARIFGVRVETFSLGFGPTLTSLTDRHGIRWRLAAIPLGGYVKFFGDAGAASNPDVDRLTEMRRRIEAEHGPSAVEDCYHFKPVWQRAIVAAAGPFANFVLALVIFTFAVGIAGERGFAPVIGSVTPDSPAQAAGFQKGDVVTHVQGRPIRYYEELQRFAALSAGDDAVITVEREGRPVDVEVTVGRRTTMDPAGGETTMGYIGVSLGRRPVLRAPAADTPAAAAGFEAGDVIVAVGGRPVDYFVEVGEALDETQSGPLAFTVERDGRRMDLVAEVEQRTFENVDGEEETYGWIGLVADVRDELLIERYGPFGTLARGAARTWDAAAVPAVYLARTVTGRESGRELGGVLRIGRFAGTVAEQAYGAGSNSGGFLTGLRNALGALILLAGALSVAIGLLNLLPIPILDGGHLVYYAYEAVAGRPLGEGAQEWGFRVGLALVLGLMIFATWNDLRYLGVFQAIGNVLS